MKRKKALIVVGILSVTLMACTGSSANSGTQKEPVKEETVVEENTTESETENTTEENQEKDNGKTPEPETAQEEDNGKTPEPETAQKKDTVETSEPEEIPVNEGDGLSSEASFEHLKQALEAAGQSDVLTMDFLDGGIQDEEINGEQVYYWAAGYDNEQLFATLRHFYVTAEGVVYEFDLITAEYVLLE